MNEAPQGTRRVTHVGFPGQTVLIVEEDFDPAIHDVEDKKAKPKKDEK